MTEVVAYCGSIEGAVSKVKVITTKKLEFTMYDVKKINTKDITSQIIHSKVYNQN